MSGAKDVGADGDQNSSGCIPENWCGGAKEYWRRQDATVNGMLGGFENLASRDVKGSRKFISSLTPVLPGTSLVLDVGAGIGRVSKDLLLHVFDKVSMLECTEAFIAKARELIPAERIESVFPVTMQDFRAEERDCGRYDMVWIQWVIIYASDEELVRFLQECGKLLKPSGLLCIKDNVILPMPVTRVRGRRTAETEEEEESVEDVLLDEEDCSVTRSERYLLELARLADLELVRREPQGKFPKEIFPVVMYAFSLKQH